MQWASDPGEIDLDRSGSLYSASRHWGCFGFFPVHNLLCCKGTLGIWIRMPLMRAIFAVSYLSRCLRVFRCCRLHIVFLVCPHLRALFLGLFVCLFCVLRFSCVFHMNGTVGLSVPLFVDTHAHTHTHTHNPPLSSRCARIYARLGGFAQDMWIRCPPTYHWWGDRSSGL